MYTTFALMHFKKHCSDWGKMLSLSHFSGRLMQVTQIEALTHCWWKFHRFSPELHRN